MAQGTMVLRYTCCCSLSNNRTGTVCMVGGVLVLRHVGNSVQVLLIRVVEHSRAAPCDGAHEVALLVAFAGAGSLGADMHGAAGPAACFDAC